VLQLMNKTNINTLQYFWICTVFIWVSSKNFNTWPWYLC